MITQLSIYAENKKGAMKEMTSLLQQAGLDIDAFVTNDSAEFGTVRMIVSDPDKAYDIFTRAGYLVKKVSVLMVAITDVVGSLDKLLECIQQANVNIDYLYATYDRISAGPIIVIRTEDMAELENYLRSHGYATR